MAKCNGTIVRNHGYADGRKSYYPCRSDAQWRVEWLSRAKANGPTTPHDEKACSSHLVQILQQGVALAIDGHVHVLHVTNPAEWRSTD